MIDFPSSFDEFSDGYDAVFCDVWGVVHNGVRPYTQACAALMRYRARGGAVVLVSNSPRPLPSFVQQLNQIGVPQESYDAIVTSGDVCRLRIRDFAGRAVFHLGPQRDAPLFEGLGVMLVKNASDAAVVVCTGLFDDTCETAESYRTLFSELIPLSIPMICANPDLVVERGGQLIPCAGALADLYQEMGGAVSHTGKPHRPIYEVARDLLNARGFLPQRILAIGDALRTDIAGAHNAVVDALFIAEGIHAHEVIERSDKSYLSPEKLNALVSRAGFPVKAAMLRLM